MTLKDVNLSNSAAFDGRSLNHLKMASKESSPEAIKAVAKQFEAIFMNMMLKSMREASSPQDNLFDNEQSKTFTSMLDQQMSQSFSEKGMGLSDILVKQLSKASHIDPLKINETKSNVEQGHQNKAKPLNGLSIVEPLTKNIAETFNDFKHKFEGYAQSIGHSLENGAALFKSKMQSHADEVSRVAGLPSNLLIGQAALETGFGKKEILLANGENSHNLFGIKATKGWSGKIAEVTTTEYVNGVKSKRIEKFRAYDSYAQSFKDFANLIKTDPRYKSVIENTGNANDYARALQKSGYATDPNYAVKLANVIKKIESS